MSLLITAIGEVLWDVFPDGARFGGAPANVACHAAGLGVAAAMVSSVGDDDLGRQALVELQKRNVDTSGINVLPDVPTGMVHVELDAAGKPRFTIEQPAAWDLLQWTDSLDALAHRCDAVCFGTLGQRNAAAQEVIHQFLSASQASALKVCDVNLRPPFIDKEIVRKSLEHANVLKLSDEELEIVAEAGGCSGSEREILGELLDNWGLHLVAVTRGKGGATLVTNDSRSDCEGFPVEVKDTVGAGDAFTACMIHGLLKGMPLDVINERACKLASYVCSQHGATPPLPESFRG